MNVFRLSSQSIDDTFLGIERPHEHQSLCRLLVQNTDIPDIPIRVKATTPPLPKKSFELTQLPQPPQVDFKKSITRARQLPSVRLVGSSSTPPSSSSSSTLHESSGLISSVTPATFSSFASFKTTTQESGPNPPTIVQKTFKDMKENREWGNTVVDPFIKELRKAIIASKPEDLEEFCVQYCLSIVRKQPPPETIEIIDPNMYDASNVAIKRSARGQRKRKPKKDGRTIRLTNLVNESLAINDDVLFNDNPPSR